MCSTMCRNGIDKVLTNATNSMIQDLQNDGDEEAFLQFIEHGGAQTTLRGCYLKLCGVMQLVQAFISSGQARLCKEGANGIMGPCPTIKTLVTRYLLPNW